MARISVLLADDHPLFLEGVRSVLAAAGSFDIAGTAGSVDQLLSRWKAVRSDVVVTDVSLGGAPVAPVITELSSLRARVLVLADGATSVQLRSVLNAGALGVASKREPVSMLVRRLTEVADGHPSLCREALAAMFSHTPPPLTARQLEVLSLMDKGLSRKQVARELCLSEAGVKSHLHAVYTELQVSSARAALAKLRSFGVLEAVS